MPDPEHPASEVDVRTIEQVFPDPQEFLDALKDKSDLNVQGKVLAASKEMTEAVGASNGWEAEWNCLGLPEEAKERFQKTFDKTKGRYSALAAVHCPGDPERAITFVLVFKEVMNRGGFTIVDAQQQPTNLAQEVNLHPLADYVVNHLEFFAEKFMVPIPPGIDYYLPDPSKAVGELQSNPQLRKDIKARLTCQWRFNNNLKEIGAEAEIRGLGIPAHGAADFRERYLVQIPEDHQKVARIEAQVVAHFPGDIDRQRVLAKVLNRTLAAADCAIVEQNQHTDLWDKVNLHPLAFWVAKNLDVLVEQVGLSPQEVLRFKLLNEKTVYERRVKIIDYQRQRVYKFSPEKAGEFLEGKTKGVLITVQNGLGDDADQNERWFRKNLPFAKDVPPEATQAIFRELIEERQLLQRATQELAKAVTASSDPTLPYLVLPPPAHLLGDQAHLDTVLGRLSFFADLQHCWATDTPFDKVTGNRLKQHIATSLATGTVNHILGEEYREEESWLIRQMPETLEVWGTIQEMNELGKLALILKGQLSWSSAEIRDLYANREELKQIWEKVAPNKPLESRYLPENWADLIRTLTIARAEDRTALRLYDEEKGDFGEVVDLGRNLDRGRIVIDNFYLDFSLKKWQEKGYLDSNFNFTELGIAMLAARVQAALRGESPDGMKPLAQAKVGFRAQDKDISPFFTIGFLTKGMPFAKEHQPYFWQAEQALAHIHTLKGKEDDKVLWGKTITTFAHFGRDGAKAEKLQQKTFREWQAFKQTLPPGEMEMVKEPGMRDMEIIFDEKGLPDRIIVMDQVLPEEEWLEKEARRELQVFYDQEFEKRAEPLIERAAVAVYGEEETVIKHRGKANLARASRLKLSRALTQSFAKAVRDGYSTGICVLTDDPDERVGVATAPVVMAAVAPNKKAWEGEGGLSREVELFKQGETFKPNLKHLNPWLMLGALTYEQWDVFNARDGDSGLAAMASRVNPRYMIGARPLGIRPRRLEDVFVDTTAFLSSEIADMGQGGQSQISLLRTDDRLYAQSHWFITSSSKHHPLPELALIGCGDLIRRTVRSKVSNEEKQMKLSQLMQAKWDELHDSILHKAFLDTMIVFRLSQSPQIKQQALARLTALRQKLFIDKQ